MGYVGDSHSLPEPLRSRFLAGGADMKRLMPGKLFVGEGGDLNAFGPVLRYDASTGSGSGGGPLIDLESGLVLGIHLGGQWTGSRKENFAAPAWELLKEPRAKELLVEHAARFEAPEAKAPPKPSALGLKDPIPYDPEFLSGFRAPLPLPTKADLTGPTLKGRPLDYVRFSLVMNEKRGTALFTAANVDRDQLLRVPRPGNDNFWLDARLAPELQSNADFFRGNGFDRGHLANPRTVSWGDYETAKRAYQAAFAYTNIAPQLAPFNQRGWAALEDHVLAKLRPESRRLCLFVGPALRPDDFVHQGRQVPRSFWMVAVLQNPAEPSKPFVEAFMMEQYQPWRGGDLVPIPHERRPDFDARVFAVGVEQIEALTALDFGPLKGLDPRSQRDVANGLYHVGRTAEGAIPLADDVEKKADKAKSKCAAGATGTEVRQAARQALSQGALPDDATAPVQALGANDPSVRSGAEEVLASSKAAIPALTRALSNESATIRLGAASALGRRWVGSRPRVRQRNWLAPSRTRMPWWQ